MVKLKDIYNLSEDKFENKKPVKEVVGMLTLAAIIKKFIDKNPQMLDKLKNLVNNL